jgi:hypothetical protein
MLKTIEAVWEKDGRLRLLERIDPPKGGVRFLVTVLPAEAINGPSLVQIDDDEEAIEGLATVSEPLLRKLWDEEDEDHGWTGL